MSDDRPVPPKGPSHYSVHVVYVPAGEEGGPRHDITLVCDRCEATWTAKQFKVFRADNATRVMIIHRTECPGLPEYKKGETEASPSRGS